jgi:hypothetical protein
VLYTLEMDFQILIRSFCNFLEECGHPMPQGLKSHSRYVIMPSSRYPKSCSQVLKIQFISKRSNDCTLEHLRTFPCTRDAEAIMELENEIIGRGHNGHNGNLQIRFLQLNISLYLHIISLRRTARVAITSTRGSDGIFRNVHRSGSLA